MDADIELNNMGNEQVEQGQGAQADNYLQIPQGDSPYSRRRRYLRSQTRVVVCVVFIVSLVVVLGCITLIFTDGFDWVYCVGLVLCGFLLVLCIVYAAVGRSEEYLRRISRMCSEIDCLPDSFPDSLNGDSSESEQDN